jgi:ABC-type transport system involved in Fe-S cluster assembly fused permease/ATPase subunit
LQKIDAKEAVHTTPPKKKIKPTKVILKLLPYLWITDWRLRARVCLSIFFIMLSMALNLSIPLVLKKLISLFELSTRPVFITQVFLIAYGVLWTLSQITIQMREIVMFRVMERGIRLLSLKLFQHFQALSLRFHVARKTGAIVSAIERAQDSFPDIFWGIFLSIIPTIAEVLIAMAILWYMYGFQYGLTLFSILVSYIIFSSISMEWSTKAQRISNEKKLNAGARIVDSLLNFETVKYFSNQKFEIEQTNKILKEREDATPNYHITTELVHLGQGIVLGIGLITLTWMVGNNVIKGTMNVSDFILINGYLIQFVTPLSWFGYVLRKLRKGLTDMEAVFNLLQLKPEIVDAPNAISLHITQATIKFDHVYFWYDARRPILKDVNFTVPVGQTVAIVGPTGSGKSTIARLLFRFYDVNEGSIKINDHDIRSITQESLQKIMGIVPQDTVLFNNSLYYNVAYGDIHASPEDVEHAIKLAHLDGFIKRLPEGLNTPVGERGLKLSGGEKQRVAIARVLLHKPVIYIFDEATSALDTHTEQEIQKNLEEISAGSTTLIIAHRLSTVTHADTIIVLEHGSIVEQGSHRELLKKGGLYARLWAKQAQECEEFVDSIS